VRQAAGFSGKFTNLKAIVLFMEVFVPSESKKEKKDEDISDSGLPFVQDVTVSDDWKG
jgi:hypothetical protein